MDSSTSFVPHCAQNDNVAVMTRGKESHTALNQIFMSPLKIAVIGGGGIAGVHLPHLVKRDDVELVGLADLNLAARETAGKFGIERFENDYHALLPLCDALLICVPTFLHADIACEALGASKAVFCEKPLARTLEQSDRIADAVRASGAPFQVGFVRRFDDQWLRWRQTVQAGKIGRPVVWHDVASTSAPGAWFMRDELGGGPFLDGCIHNLDFALSTFGPAEWAFCHGHTLGAGHSAVDSGTATVRFQSGDELMLAWSWGLPKGCSGARVFELLGPQGVLRWPELKAGESTHFVWDNGETSEAIFYAEDALQTAFAHQMDEFCAVARRQASPRAGIGEGRAALNLALAILESARSSHVVSVAGNQ